MLLESANSEGVPERDALEFLQKHQENKLILVAAMPKSGSTFLSNTLAAIADLRMFRLSSGYSTNEHDLYLPAMIFGKMTGCVSLLHMRGTYHNVQLMKRFKIRPIVLVRDIFDIIVSLTHDLMEMRQRETTPTGQTGYSFIWLDESFNEFDQTELTDAIIELALPWFVNFYASWYTLCERGDIEASWVTYEELLSAKEQTMRILLAEQGIGEDTNINPELLSRKYRTYRTAKIGGGEIELTDDQRTRIRDKFRFYPNMDLSRIGL